jgi:serine/threonine-protein kinase
LLDLGSKNGTQLNDEFIKEAVNLKHGDRIRGGQTELEVTLEAPSHSDATMTLARPAQAPSPPTLTGTPLPTIPGYRLLEELGRGGMGVVYKGIRECDGITVAVKTILPAVSPTPETVGRFLREAEILKGLAHPRIVPFRDMGEAGELLYFAMDFVNGTDAGRLLKQHGPLPMGRAVALICGVLEGLAFAHGRGFVHRDVKPANVLVSEVGGGEEARLADFGLARTYQASQLSGLTLAGAVGGSPPFMPPEQVLDFRSVKPPADQYSSAATLYTLLTGEHVHGSTRSVSEAFKKILQSDPAPLRQLRPEIPQGLAEAVHRALGKKPEDRFPGVDAFRRALAPFAQGS